MDGNGFPNPWNPPALTATDPEGDTLTWSAYYAVPSDATEPPRYRNGSSGIFAYAPNSLRRNGSFKVKVSDGNLTDELGVRVTVSAQADPFNKYSCSPLVYALENNATDWPDEAHTNAGDPPLLLFQDNVYVLKTTAPAQGVFMSALRRAFPTRGPRCGATEPIRPMSTSSLPQP